MKKYNFALVGATGLVGRTFLDILEHRNLPINNLYLMASKKSAGQKINFCGKQLVVEELNENSFEKDIDFAFFSAGGNVSKKFAPIAASCGVTVIDNSSAFRMDKDIPLVVPEVNAHLIKNYKGIIANPNCSTIQAVVALKPLHDEYTIKRVIYSTYQAVSGAGITGKDDLINTLKGDEPKTFVHSIANNCIPHIDVFTDNGYTFEEMKMINETKKILGENLQVTATAVRVPVLDSHSESITVEFEKDYSLENVLNIYEKSDGIVLQNDTSKNLYPLATTAKGTDPVYVGRIRRDFSANNSLNIWVVADNIRKGAALNGIQIVEYIINN